ncbi:MAG: hypothetical protein KF901_23660 [Myxococcales bacterium]|nr:hypothetical protein [Myxococcales bacterium]
MLNAVLEFELITVDFVPIVSLQQRRVVAWRLERRTQTELLAGLPPLTPERLATLAREEGRAACLERLWQKVSIERVARFASPEPVLVPTESAAFEGAWRPISLARLARAHGVHARVALELDVDAQSTVARRRLTAEVRLAGLGVAARGEGWRDVLPHWVLAERRAAGLSALAADTFVRDARLVITGVDRREQLRGLCEAGVDYVTGDVFGRPGRAPTRPDAALVWGASREAELALGAAAYEPPAERSVFGPRYAPEAI